MQLINIVALAMALAVPAQAGFCNTLLGACVLDTGENLRCDEGTCKNWDPNLMCFPNAEGKVICPP
ncbi:hypothetical protein C8035_v003877 [Colletotrichum spinosum]|uniref:Uncharacterized protein n=1 Tax=Colletotrichum spinosum TaxID=1347390 RepID=A0A4R8PSX1_9PEZI|nr:hypothetical protein C8035_v003877 [Colletotrichum spinosum]